MTPKERLGELEDSLVNAMNMCEDAQMGTGSMRQQALEKQNAALMRYLTAIADIITHKADDGG